MATWFTSDNHWNHANIIEYANRPFPDLETMNQVMIERWNERVAPKDTVYHLGDFAMGPKETPAIVRPQLNGRIVLILGNHDRSRPQMLQAGFDEVHKELWAEIDGVRLYMRHRPPWSKKGVPFGDPEAWRREVGQIEPQFFLCGHVHGLWSRRGDVVNAGVDVRDFRPVSLAELLA